LLKKIDFHHGKRYKYKGLFVTFEKEKNRTVSKEPDFLLRTFDAIFCFIHLFILLINS